MKVVGISGSPRPGGNTEILLAAALQPFREHGWTAADFLCSRRTVAPCTGCESCAAGDGCILRDDMDLLCGELETCDAVIVASPVYYRNVSAQLKAVMDRSYGARARKLWDGKACGAIAVGRGEGGGQAIGLTVIHNFLLSSGAVCVPGELNGVSARADKPGDILSQPKRLEQARILGEKVMRLAEKLRPALR